MSSIRVHEQSGKQFLPAEAAAVDDNIRRQLVPRDANRINEEVESMRDFLEATEAEYSKFLIRINANDNSEKIWLDFCDAVEASL